MSGMASEQMTAYDPFGNPVTVSVNQFKRLLSKQGWTKTKTAAKTKTADNKES